MIAEDGQTVVPLVNGDTIRIRDTESNEEYELQNPAMSVTSGRRIAVVKALLEHNVASVISPPEAFCAHSYGVATANEMNFWRVKEGSTWKSLWSTVQSSADIAFVQELPKEELSSHGPHHHHH